ncbi:unnamed protein product [Cylindrotheca closterium]|uniref:PDZ domain-containing protein n=1 Tax=Cylindrotheca closterium TaxID=2856 RepID=A0AAD2G6Y9_9STRA|nr:unnamed protein product [Cylindrotheca closterium]
MKTSTIVLLTTATVSGFSVQPNNVRPSTSLNGLFDGVKDAFSAPPSEIDSERETPIDRWMGWSVVAQEQEVDAATPSDFLDSMDASNYVSVELTKPMGIIFEENDAEFGGIFVQSLKEGGAAEESGKLKSGDQLVIVGTKNVSGLDFDDALGAIIDAPEEKVKITLFRGTGKQFYGPTGPSKEWLAEFCTKGGVESS